MDLLDLYGIGYLFSFIKVEYERDQEEKAYRVYVTDSLQAGIAALAKLLGQDVEPLRYYDIIKNNAIEEEKKPDEVISNIKNKLSLMQEE